MSSEQIWNILAKYFSGEASLQEQEVVNEWNSKSENNQKIFKFFQEVWSRKSDSGSLENVDIDKVWLATRDKLEDWNDSNQKALQIKGAEKQKENKKRLFRVSKVAQYAAAVILITAIFSGIFLYQYQEKDLSESIVYKSEVGQTLNVRLDDGSHVWLAPKSTLDLPADFNGFTRKVELEGEAYFSVESNPDKPFQVYTKNSITKVLGTQFNVMALAEESTLEVQVTEGRVAVENVNRNQSEDDIILEEGDLLQTDEQFSSYKVQNNVSKLAYLKWREGIIYLEDLPLNRISERLERWYPVEIFLESKELSDKKIDS